MRKDCALNALEKIVDSLASTRNFGALERYVRSHAIGADHLCLVSEKLRLCLAEPDLCRQRGRAASNGFRALLASVSRGPACLLRVLHMLLRKNKLPYRRFAVCFDESLTVDVVSLLKHREETTRACAFGVLERIHMSYPETLPLYQEALGNELIGMSEKRRFGGNTDFVAKLILLVLQSPAFAGEAVDYYSQFVMPALLVLNRSSASFVAMAYCRAHVVCLAPTVRYLNKRYRASDSVAQAWIVCMLGHLIGTHGAAESEESLEDPFCEIILEALSSDSYPVIDAVSALFEQKQTRKYVGQRVATILPRLFCSLYRLSKRFWHQEQRCKVLRIIDFVLQHDHIVFERCLIEYNRDKEMKKRMG